VVIFFSVERLKLTKMLSPDQISRFWRNGYIVPTFKLSESDVAKLQRLTLQLVDQNPKARAAIRRPHLDDGSGLQSAKSRLDWLSIATNSKLLDIVEQLIGPDIILWTSTLFYKASQEAATPWHRDNCPFLSLKESEAVVTAWIAVFNVRREDGALRVVPESQIGAKRPSSNVGDRHLYGRVCLSEFEESTAVDAQLAAGNMIIFDASLVHGSWPNVRSRERYGYSVRFFPARSCFDRSSALGFARWRELILVRGNYRAGNSGTCDTTSADRTVLNLPIRLA
jgi:hypothetical protein